MSIYQEQHYEDVASILRSFPRCQCRRFVAEDVFPSDRLDRCDVTYAFADLFAADNPPTCIDCGARRGETNPDCASHLFAGGFDRGRFLKACGLESEREC